MIRSRKDAMCVLELAVQIRKVSVIIGVLLMSIITMCSASFWSNRVAIFSFSK